MLKDFLIQLRLDFENNVFEICLDLEKLVYWTNLTWQISLKELFL